MPNNQRHVARVTRSKDDARKSYNTMSRCYDFWTHRTEGPIGARGVALLDLHEGEHVLEIGYGTGHNLLLLAHAVGGGGKVYGIDLAEGMYDVSRARLARAGLADRVELTTGDATSLPYPDSSLDAIFMSFVLELFDTPEIPRLLAECRRVLKPGGRLGVVALIKPEDTNFMIRLYEWSHEHFPAMVDCRPIYLREDLRAAGFTLQQAERIGMWGLPADIVVATRP